MFKGRRSREHIEDNFSIKAPATSRRGFVHRAIRSHGGQPSLIEDGDSRANSYRTSRAALRLGKRSQIAHNCEITATCFREKKITPSGASAVRQPVLDHV